MRTELEKARRAITPYNASLTEMQKGGMVEQKCPRLSCALGSFSKAVRESSSQSHLSEKPCFLERGVP